MSVIKFPVQEFADIYTTITNSDLKDMVLTSYEKAWLELMKSNDDETIRLKIGCWVERLYIANHTAFNYQYNCER